MQLTSSDWDECSTWLPALKRLVHGFNNFWFRRIKSPGLAFGNVLIFEKRK